MELKKTVFDFVKWLAVIVGMIWTVTQMNEAAINNAVSLEKRLTRIETLLERVIAEKP